MTTAKSKKTAASTRTTRASAPARQSRAKPPAAKNAPPAFKRVAKPDALDFRDRPFTPNISIAPALRIFPKVPLKVLHQGDTNACTGFGLSLVVQHLLRSSRRKGVDPAVSPFMLYSMARRYDEFPGATGDDGSSLRGALKGWFKHGVCSSSMFPDLDMPKAPTSSKDDWWLDAVRRPLGAYYRIDPRSITDMHAALNEVGILYVSAGCHSGWDDGSQVPPRKRRPTSFTDIWVIPVKGGSAAHPGHAFAIVGYNETGFLVQNSWGSDWGSYGYATLTYDDWLRNAMDCWVAQLGVVTREHQDIAKNVSLRIGR
ncbi:MAG: C1 family peptidase, partial [Burkholderiaceae bacterium]